jgi:hypothetical protein
VLFVMPHFQNIVKSHLNVDTICITELFTITHTLLLFRRPSCTCSIRISYRFSVQNRQF